MRTKNAIMIWIASLALQAPASMAATYGISLGEGQGEPGQVGSVSVYLNSAADVASVEFQLNYDASLLAVVGVTNPPDSLGGAFGVDCEAEDGRLIIRLFRTDGLTSGSGQLCQVLFAVNAGAEPGLWCDLALADAALSTQYGADLRWKNTVVRENNQFWATYSHANDADHDGLSDYEEQMMNGSADYVPGEGDTAIDDSDTDGDGMGDGWEAGYGLDPLADDADGDADGDGLTNGQEAPLGFDPTKTDTDGDGYPDRSEYVAGTCGTNNGDYLMLGMEPESDGEGREIFCWRSETGRVYSVFYSSNLMGLWPTTPLHVVHGDGTDQAFTNESAADPKGYFRLKVDLE